MREASHGCDGLDPLQFHYCMTLSLSDICKIVIRPAEGERYITPKPLHACQLNHARSEGLPNILAPHLQTSCRRPRDVALAAAYLPDRLLVKLGAL